MKTRKTLLLLLAIVMIGLLVLSQGCDNGLLTAIEQDILDTIPAPTYTITYEGNENTGGAVPLDLNKYKEGDTVTVLGNVNNLIRDGYSFYNWNTSSNGSGTDYTEGPSLIMGDANITLYAQWTTDPVYTVTYHSNGGVGSPPSDTKNYKTGEAVTVLGVGDLSRTGYSFNGWNRNADGSGANYLEDEVFIIGTSNVDLYANWSINNYTVTYHGNGNTSGTVPSGPQTFSYGATVTVLENTGALYKADYATFSHWNTDNDWSGISYAENDTFTMPAADVDLYAVWEWDVYALRDTGPSGGWIFYINPNAGTDGWKYLEASPENMAPSSWGTSYEYVDGADGTAVGTGKQNTIDIILGDTAADKAADRCASYSVVSGSVTYDDWFLPSKYELNEMFLELRQYGIGGFVTNDKYWSSSEAGWNATTQYFYGEGWFNYNDKTDIYQVRAARSF